MSRQRCEVIVRNTRLEDFEGIVAISRQVYTPETSWTVRLLESHLRIFPEGQLVAVRSDSGEVMGMAAGLILRWEDYDSMDAWRDLTDHGWFTNHDPSGRTFYGAEMMVRPDSQGQGVGSKLYQARFDLVRRLGLLRIRAGARLRGFRRYADRLSARQYVEKVVRGKIYDPTLSFQLKRGFQVLQVVPGYLPKDPASLGYAALIEWLNPDRARPEDYEAQGRSLLK